MKTKALIYGLVLSFLIGTPALACHKKHHKKTPTAPAAVSPAAAESAG